MTTLYDIYRKNGQQNVLSAQEVVANNNAPFTQPVAVEQLTKEQRGTAAGALLSGTTDSLLAPARFIDKTYSFIQGNRNGLPRKEMVNNQATIDKKWDNPPLFGDNINNYRKYLREQNPGYYDAGKFLLPGSAIAAKLIKNGLSKVPDQFSELERELKRLLRSNFRKAVDRSAIEGSTRVLAVEANDRIGNVFQNEDYRNSLNNWLIDKRVGQK